MKLSIKIIFIAVLFFHSLKGFSQDYYKIESYKIDNGDKNADSWPIHKGSIIFKYLRILPKISIEYKYMDDEKFNSNWSNFATFMVKGKNSGKIVSTEYMLTNFKVGKMIKDNIERIHINKDKADFILSFNSQYKLTKIYYNYIDKITGVKTKYELYPIPMDL